AWRFLTLFLTRNTRSGSRRNIAAHYDLSNEFFSLWLDPTMMYSCAIYQDAGAPIPPADLHRAQLVRLDRLRDRLAVTPDDHVLEIGTGWGGLATHFARTTGCRVTTTTISKEQAAYARALVAGESLAPRVTILEQDYRDLRGEFDKLVSVEMIEAVGPEFLGTYFASCAGLLKPGGLFMLQAIVIEDRFYTEGANWVDFIKKHIFPGSFIPSRAVLKEAAHHAGFDLVETHEIGPHYATTLAEWRRRFFAQLPRVKALGFDDTFVRMWEFYLAYCEAGFAESHLGDVQMLLRRR
ncbi:MAG: cyclopropane-fatty-acyl-phospholipid synthase family protein, partial [Planctomycetota bacterium]